MHTWEKSGVSGETADEGRISSRGLAAAGAVVAAILLLVSAPAVIAVVAIASPGDLDRAFGWLSGGSVAFFLVAAGRVPAAALLAVALAGRRTRS
jgi:hypothetical protein